MRRASRREPKRAVSIFKNEIDAAHELSPPHAEPVLDFLGEPRQQLRHSIVDTKSKRTSFDYSAAADGGTSITSRSKTGPSRGRRRVRTGILAGRVWRSGWCWARFTNLSRDLVELWMSVRATKAEERAIVRRYRTSHRERIASKKDIPISNTYRIVRTRYYSLFGVFRRARRRRARARVHAGTTTTPDCGGNVTETRPSTSVALSSTILRGERRLHRDVRAEPGVHERPSVCRALPAGVGTRTTHEARRPDPRTPVPTR